MSLDYSQFCGPAALAAITSIPQELAAEYLDENKGRKHRASTNIHTMVAVLEQLGYYCELTRPVDTISVSQFRHENPSGVFLILAAHHFITIWDGVLLNTNGVYPSRAKVGWVVRIAQ
jgi:hypothetical protein